MYQQANYYVNQHQRKVYEREAEREQNAKEARRKMKRQRRK